MGDSQGSKPLGVAVLSPLSPSRYRNFGRAFKQTYEIYIEWVQQSLGLIGAFFLILDRGSWLGLMQNASGSSCGFCSLWAYCRGRSGQGRWALWTVFKDKSEEHRPYVIGCHSRMLFSMKTTP